MNLRWYISTLIIILTLLGVVDYQQTSDPNQEIVLQFTNTEVSSDDAQNAIANVKQQLQDLGVDNIQVTEGKEKGKLIITYFSNVDVANIKESLSNNEEIALNSSEENQNKNHSQIPSEENPSSYNLDVYEIHKDSGSGWDLNGVSVTELKSEGSRLSNPNIYAFIDSIEVRGITDKVAYTTHYNIALSINNTLYKIPEVRAGPLT